MAPEEIYTKSNTNNSAIATIVKLNSKEILIGYFVHDNEREALTKKNKWKFNKYQLEQFESNPIILHGADIIEITCKLRVSGNHH